MIQAISRLVERRRSAAYRIPLLRWMAWMDRALCVTVYLHRQTYHDHDEPAPLTPDAKPLVPRVRRADMKSNGPRCTTKRWWIYGRWGAACVDLDSTFFS